MLDAPAPNLSDHLGLWCHISPVLHHMGPVSPRCDIVGASMFLSGLHVHFFSVLPTGPTWRSALHAADIQYVHA